LKGGVGRGAQVRCRTRVGDGARVECEADVGVVSGFAVVLCWGDECGALLELNGGVGCVAWVGCWDVRVVV